MKSCSWFSGVSRPQIALLHSPEGVSPFLSLRGGGGEVVRGGVETRGPILTESPSCIDDRFHKPHPLEGGKKSIRCVESPLSPPFPSLPQIKISVIKLIKVMRANMPHGSRPDFIRRTVRELRKFYL